MGLEASPPADGTVTYTRLTGDVRMIDVDFGYEENKIVLHNITLYAEPGQKVAFVGATGAGKTTITNLLNRFYDIADGKIRYDGININKIRKSDLRRAIGIVLQDTNLFTGTVLDNIRYGRLDASDEECIAAAERVGADDFISSLPEGYHTLLTGNGGKSVSGPEAAAGDRPGRRGGSAGNDSRRGHLLDRYPHGGHRTARHGRSDERADGVCYRSPAVYGEKFRRDHGPGTRPDH